MLATGSDDGTVRLWDPNTGTPIGQPLTGHTLRVTSMAFGTLADGRTVLVTGSYDRTATIWCHSDHIEPHEQKPKDHTH